MRQQILLATLCCLIVGIVAGYDFDFPANVAASNRSPRLSAMPSGSDTPKSHCTSGEQVVFSCTIQKSLKVLSICSSKRLTERQGYVQYRFGKPGKIEMVFPAERENSMGKFGYNRYTRPLITYLALRFESNGYKYSLHQDSNAEEKPSVNSSYLNVTSPEPDAKPIEMTCRQPVIGNLMFLDDVVPQNDDTDVLNP